MATEKAVNFLLFDIETTGLYADWDHMLCMSYQWYGEKEVHTIAQEDWEMDNLLDDEGIAAEAVRILSQADAWCGWYSSRFDEPFIRSRNARWGGPSLPRAQTQVRHLDLWDVCRRAYKFRSNRLDNVSKFWPNEKENIGEVSENLEGITHRKTVMDPHIWQLARVGDKDALQYVYDHCEADIHVLREVFEKFRDDGVLPPAWNLAKYFDIEEKICPRCGEPFENYQKRGWAVAGASRRQRVQILPCGHWGRLFHFKDRTEIR